MSIHVPIGVNDALTMLDSRIPLTASERKMIVEGLYNLAFEAGVRAEKYRAHDELVQIAQNYSDEYEDPTTTIRRGLEEKKRNDR